MNRIKNRLERIKISLGIVMWVSWMVLTGSILYGEAEAGSSTLVPKGPLDLRPGKAKLKPRPADSTNSAPGHCVLPSASFKK